MSHADNSIALRCAECGKANAVLVQSAGSFRIMVLCRRCRQWTEYLLEGLRIQEMEVVPRHAASQAANRLEG